MVIDIDQAHNNGAGLFAVIPGQQFIDTVGIVRDDAPQYLKII